MIKTFRPSTKHMFENITGEEMTKKHKIVMWSVRIGVVATLLTLFVWKPKISLLLFIGLVLGGVYIALSQGSKTK